MRLTLVGSCPLCGHQAVYNWTLFTQNDSRQVPLKWMIDTKTIQNSISLVLVPKKLEKRREYRVKLNVQTNDGSLCCVYEYVNSVLLLSLFHC